MNMETPSISEEIHTMWRTIIILFYIRTRLYEYLNPAQVILLPLQQSNIWGTEPTTCSSYHRPWQQQITYWMDTEHRELHAATTHCQSCCKWTLSGHGGRAQRRWIHKYTLYIPVALAKCPPHEGPMGKWRILYNQTVYSVQLIIDRPPPISKFKPTCTHEHSWYT